MQIIKILKSTYPFQWYLLMKVLRDFHLKFFLNVLWKQIEEQGCFLSFLHLGRNKEI